MGSLSDTCTRQECLSCVVTEVGGEVGLMFQLPCFDKDFRLVSALHLLCTCSSDSFAVSTTMMIMMMMMMMMVILFQRSEKRTFDEKVIQLIKNNC